jgi:GNAT superfamily N-acetyltransferase
MDVVYQLETITQELTREAQALFKRNGQKKLFPSHQFEQYRTQESKALTARYDSLLIGFNATMPISIYHSGVESDAIWSCDFIVDESWQGRGVGKKIKDNLRAYTFVPILSLGISNTALHVLKSRGWQTKPALHSYYLVTKPTSIKSFFLWCWGLAVYIPNPRQGSRSTAYHLTTELPNVTEIDSLWESSKRLYRACVVRDSQYINWRYQKYYRFLQIRDWEGRLNALVIFRMSGKCLKISDYLVRYEQTNAVAHAIRYLVNELSPSITVFEVVNPVIERQLKAKGFIKSPYSSNFAIYSDDTNTSIDEWSLSSGDSDGDFVATAGLDNTLPLDQSAYRKWQKISEEEFISMENEWEELLSKSDANILFHSHAWLCFWWKTWRYKLETKFDAKLEIHCLRIDGKLAAIIPLYQTTKRKFGKRFIEYHFLGNATRLIPTIRSEYVSPIVIRGYQTAIINAINELINSLPPLSRLVWPDCSSQEYVTDLHSINIASDVGTLIDTKFQAEQIYYSKLGKNLRTKSLNRLKTLCSEYPDHEWIELTPNDKNIGLFFEILNKLHCERWGKVCFDESAISFHKALISNSQTINPRLSLLKINGQHVSALYCLEVSTTRYYIQSGFDEKFSKRYSLGGMHLMKTIKDCFCSDNVEVFDMLAGQGLKVDYKRRYYGKSVMFKTYLIFPNRLILRLYRPYHKLKTLIRRLTG